MLSYAVESLSLAPYSGPLHHRLYEALRDAILDGRFPPESRIPATRLLAEHLAVSRNTVVTAFEQLQAEGYVTAKVGHGTRVAPIAPEDLIACAPTPPRRRVRKPDEPVPPPREIGPFEPGQPDTRSFPHGLWARLLARSARNIPHQATPYGDPMGDPALRTAIARHVREYRAVGCEADQVLITTSAQAGMTLVARFLVAPGREVWMEEPGYPGALQAFRDAGARIVPVPVDHEGMDPEAAPDTSDPALIYVTPSHQFPLGAAMPLSRRLALLERAARAGAHILEDDYDSEFRFAGRPVAALQGLDQAGSVIYMGTFSKTLMPGLRVGYLVLPERLAEDLQRNWYRLAALQPAAVVQSALALFMTEGHYAAHIRRMRTIYAVRLEALEAACADLPVGARLGRCSTGLQVPLYLNPGSDDKALAERGREAGLSLNALSAFYQNMEPRRGFLLGFANVPEARMAAHVATLAGLLGGPDVTTR